MCLSLNPIQQEYLASGSEDHSVRVWDLDDLQCKAHFTELHKDKVQQVRWNCVNDQVLLSGGYDKKINVFDVKSQKDAISTYIPKSCNDIELIQWHPKSEHNFAVSTEAGVVLGYDSRKLKDPVFKMQAHEKQVSSVSFSPFISNMMATSSTDGVVKVWDIAAEGGSKPLEVGSRHMKQGELFSMQFSNDIPWVLACGGSQGEIAIWDSSENISIESHFKPFLEKGSYDSKDYNPNAVIEEEDGNEDFESMSDEEASKKKKDKKKSKKKQK